MRGRQTFPFRTLLIGLVAIKIGGTFFYLIGTVSIADLFFHQPVAIAQEKASDASPQHPAPEKKPGPDAAPKNVAPADVSAVMKRLDIERQRLEAEQERINHQREQLEALKSEIETKIDALSTIQQKIAADLDKKEAVLSEKEQKQKAAEEAKIRMLSKVYASMKPKQAAAIIDKMDIEVIEKVFLQMKGEQVGNILSYVEKDRAAKISERLAESNTVPSP
jgi:flagellar motility protein MotE (MotC chaperone)